METTTPDYFYDYGNVTAGTSLGFDGPCILDEINKLGAHISTIYYLMFVFSVVGNGLVLFIIHRFEKLTTVTNIFLLNLVLSSLIFLTSLPFWAVYTQMSEWIFGRAVCKIVGSIYYLGLYSSVLFLTLLTFDRHLAVVYSLGALQLRTKRYAVGSCVVVWLVSGLACIKPMLLQNIYRSNWDNKIYCGKFSQNNFIDEKLLENCGFYIQLFLFLIFPLVVIVYCYVRIGITVVSSRIVSKFKTVRLIFIIVLLFFICWAPYNIMQLLPPPESCKEAMRRGYTMEVTRNLAYIYFCFSPMFYTFVGKKFQNYFRQVLVRRFPWLQDHISLSQYSRNNHSTKSTPNEL